VTRAAAPRQDWASRPGLIRLDKQFLDWLRGADDDLHVRLLAARAAPDALDAKAEADLVIAVGGQLEPFLAD
jgi:hypothetical protein